MIMELSKWIAQTRKGTLELGILVLLRNKKRYGLEILDILEKDSGLVVTEGTLYPLMNRLKREGLVISEWVESESGHPRKYYALSKEGKKLVEQMIEYWGKFSKTLSKLIEEGR
jgi:PadR family transcriptional regulator PadR